MLGLCGSNPLGVTIPEGSAPEALMCNPDGSAHPTWGVRLRRQPPSIRSGPKLPAHVWFAMKSSSWSACLPLGIEPRPQDNFLNHWLPKAENQPGDLLMVDQVMRE